MNSAFVSLSSCYFHHFPLVLRGRKNIIASVWLDLRLWTVCAEIVQKSTSWSFQFSLDDSIPVCLGARDVRWRPHLFLSRNVYCMEIRVAYTLTPNPQIFPSCCQVPCKAAHIVPHQSNSQH